MNTEDILELYQKIKDNINSDDVKFYWDNFFYKYHKFYRYLFMDGSCTPDFYDVNFLTKRKFERTKININDNISFNLINVYELYNLEEKYDFINLSNIMNYEIDKYKYAKFIKKMITKNLEKNGMILATYSWLPTVFAGELAALEETGCNPKVLKIEKKYQTYSEVNSAIICKN